MSEFDDMIKRLTGTEYTDAEWVERDAQILEDRQKAGREERSVEWQKRKQGLIDKGLAKRHLSEIYRGQIKQIPAIAAVKNIGSDGVYVLSGNVGCGKTFAAHVWLLDALGGKPERWRVRDIRFATATWFARTSRYGQGKFEDLGKPGRLVLDDLGVEYADENKSFLVDLDELLDMRWSNGYPTLVTTNLTDTNFQARYGARLYDRMRGAGRWRNVKHKSMRGTDG